MTLSFRKVAVASWAALRSFWLIIGLWLALLLAIETCFRVKNDVIDARAGEQRPSTLVAGDPRSAPWEADFRREFNETRPNRWIPYLYFGRRPNYHGRYIQIDSVGHRITPQPTTPAVPVVRVFMFGGSTMWGDAQRGDHTIAAEAARRLNQMAGSRARVEVTNFGEVGYVFTQEIVDLMLQLREGHRPNVVVFYDGLNDVASTVQYGVPGLPQNEAKRSAEFDMGRALDRTGFARGFGKDMRALGLLFGQSMRQLEVSDWVLSHKPAQTAAYVAADSAARATVRTYESNVELVEALAARYGFTPVYVWQPSLHASEKKLNAFEQRLRRRIEQDPYHSRIQQVHRVLPRMLDSAMAPAAPGRFVDAASLFRGDTLAVYTDWLGHNTEAAVPHIVDAFWPALESATRGALEHPAATQTAPAARRPAGN